MPLGRHVTHYERSGFLVRPPRLSLPRSVEIDDGSYRNIADFDLGTLQIYCTPNTGLETARSKRIWGYQNQKCAVIMPFRFRAQCRRGCKIRNFEVDLHFSHNEAETGPHGQLPESQISLLEEPLPETIKGPAASSRLLKTWTFSSQPISDHNGLASSARWLWTANDQDTCTLHGAVILQHSAQPLWIRCKARAQAKFPLRHCMSSLKLRFKNNEETPNQWSIKPREPSYDNTAFEHAIHEMKAQIDALNRGTSIGEYIHCQ